MLGIGCMLAGLALRSLHAEVDAPAEVDAQAEVDAPAGAEAADAVPQASHGVIIRLEGMVSPMMKSFLMRKLDEARRAQADLVVLEIDSPGGFVHTTLDIADYLRVLPWATTVAYVPREALSGAAIMALACDEIVVSPSARMGDAGPIVMGQDSLFRHAPEKIRSDLARRVRDMAEDRDRPPALAEAMVDHDLVVYQVRHRETGETWYLSDPELESGEFDMWEKGPPVMESREGYFLTVNGQRAVELKLAEALVDDYVDIAQRYGVESEMRVLRPGAVDTAVFLLNNPIVTSLLFIIGLVALYLELSAPGISIGGLVAGLCFALFFWSRFLGGTSGWLEVILFLAGVIFILTEVFVIPGFGIAGISGLALIVVSVMMASQDFVIPESERQLATTGRTLMVIAVSGLVFMVAAFVLARHFKSVPLLGQMALPPPTLEPSESWDKAEKHVAMADNGVGVGDWGVAESPLRPAGRALFGDEYVDVVTDGSYVNKGSQVRVIDIRGNRILVRPIDPPTQQSSTD